MRGNTVNNMKLTIIAKFRETHTRFLQPTRSECLVFLLSSKSTKAASNLPPVYVTIPYAYCVVLCPSKLPFFTVSQNFILF